MTNNPGGRWLVLCDFDGTYTMQDVTNLIIDHFTGTTWRDQILPRYRAGEIDHLQVMVECYAPLTVPEPELIEYSKANIKIRPGFELLQAFCQEQGAELIVVSGGLDFYIKAFLPPGVPFYSYTGELKNSSWMVRRPDWPVMTAEQDFKVRVLEELKLRFEPSQTIFIGDGFNDFPVAQQADIAFSVAGTRLASLLAANNLPYTEFTNFAQVVDTLKKLCQKTV